MLSVRGHVLRMAAMAWPIIIAEIGWMAMGLVDTLMVGPLGKAAIGAVGVANILYDTFGIFRWDCCWDWIRWWRRRLVPSGWRIAIGTCGRGYGSRYSLRRRRWRWRWGCLG